MRFCFQKYLHRNARICTVTKSTTLLGGITGRLTANRIDLKAQESTAVDTAKTPRPLEIAAVEAATDA